MNAPFSLHAWQYEVLFGESDRESALRHIDERFDTDAERLKHSAQIGSLAKVNAVIRRGVLVRRNLAVVPPGSFHEPPSRLPGPGGTPYEGVS